MHLIHGAQFSLLTLYPLFAWRRLGSQGSSVAPFQEGFILREEASLPQEDELQEMLVLPFTIFS